MSRGADWLREGCNWGRFGADDERGMFNLLTPERIVAAARLVRTGERLSLGRPLPRDPDLPNNIAPVQQPGSRRALGHPSGAGEAVDGLHAPTWHSPVLTHLDALCHVWDGEGMWNGRDPQTAFGPDGARFGGVENWREGFLCRGVLLDVPAHRAEPFVRQERPVTGEELLAVAAAQGLRPEPGDALLVHSGLAAYERVHGPMRADHRPGLSTSCLPVVRDWDCALLGWDMQDLTPPDDDGVAWSVHGVLYSFGVAVLDSVVLEPLAERCRSLGRWEFLLLVLPLVLVGGTASPVNPVAVF